jgi:hypothetical protein
METQAWPVPFQTCSLDEVSPDTTVSGDSSEVDAVSSIATSIGSVAIMAEIVAVPTSQLSLSSLKKREVLKIFFAG